MRDDLNTNVSYTPFINSEILTLNPSAKVSISERQIFLLPFSNSEM